MHGNWHLDEWELVRKRQERSRIRKARTMADNYAIPEQTTSSATPAALLFLRCWL